MHELVVDAHGVVGVLVLNADDVAAAEVHVKTGIAQGTNLVFFASLGLNEFFDVGVIDVEHHHLGCTTSGATGLDGSSRGVSTTHEGNRARCRATGVQEFLARANAREVQSSTRATLEDQAFFAVPVQDRVHGVIHGQDEAGTDLLLGGGTHVEPDRGVEREDLVDQHPRHFVLKDFGVCFGGEVTVVAAGLGVGQHDAVDELAQAGLTLFGANGATEVLRGHDGRSVD